MRDLRRNTTKIWYVNQSGEKVEVMDGAFHTGEFTTVFSEPVEARIALYPSNTKITEELFGKDASVDMVATSTSLDFTADTLIFLSQPTGEYSTTYDYSISAISPSLNSRSYGFKRRV